MRRRRVLIRSLAQEPAARGALLDALPLAPHSRRDARQCPCAPGARAVSAGARGGHPAPQVPRRDAGTRGMRGCLKRISCPLPCSLAQERAVRRASATLAAHPPSPHCCAWPRVPTSGSLAPLLNHLEEKNYYRIRCTSARSVSPLPFSVIIIILGKPSESCSWVGGESVHVCGEASVQLGPHQRRFPAPWRPHSSHWCSSHLGICKRPRVGAGMTLARWWGALRNYPWGRVALILPPFRVGAAETGDRRTQTLLLVYLYFHP